MIQKIRNIVLLVVFTLSFAASPLAATVYAQQGSQQAVCEGLGLNAGTKGCQDPANSRTVGGIVNTVIDLLSVIVGIAAVIMIIVGGLKYVLSSGDPSNISSAKNTILYAVVGLVVVAVAQVLVRFVLGKV